MKEKKFAAKAQMMIRKPLDRVFEAFIDPSITTNFWFTKSSGKLEEGKQVEWNWEMYNVSIPVKVKKIEPNERILIEWGNGPQVSTVEWTFKSLGPEKTYVTVTNYDFQGQGDALIDQIVDSTGGFTSLLAGLKAWLEHGIDLKLVEDKFPKELMEQK